MKVVVGKPPNQYVYTPDAIDLYSWNAALDAASKLVLEGFTWVRRPLDPDTMTQKIEIYRGAIKVEGEYDEATHVDCSEMEAAAIASLRISK